MEHYRTLEDGKTHYLRLPMNDELFDHIFQAFFNGERSSIKAHYGLSRKHPQDKRNDKVGRQVAKDNALPVKLLLSAINCNKYKASIYVKLEHVNKTYILVKYLDTGKCVLEDVRY